MTIKTGNPHYEQFPREGYSQLKALMVQWWY